MEGRAELGTHRGGGMIKPSTQHFQAERMGAHARRRAADHTPMVTAPGEVTDIILEAAGEAAMTR